jgi:proline iminopeptidase
MLRKILVVEKLNENTAEYRRECFNLASRNDFFNMPTPTIESNKLRHEYEVSNFYKLNIRNVNAPINFYKNETLKNINTKTILQKLKYQGIKLYGIYGHQDRIFSDSQLTDLKVIIGVNNFTYIDNCSHYLFVDQQKKFIEAIEKWAR